MKKIPLTKGLFTFVDNEDYERLVQWNWYAAKSGKKFYAARKLRGGVKIYLHRFLMSEPEKKEIDHINGNSLDNQRKNLRICTALENRANSKKYSNNTSGFKGVGRFFRDKRWRAYIQINGKCIHLGLFKNKISAAKAYNKAANKLFGKFANPNKLK